MACLLVLTAYACSTGPQRVVVAAGTTLVDSGIIDHVIDVYQELDPAIEISVVGNPTGLIIELGRQKAADLLITHAPNQEADFIDSGGASSHAPFLVSRFVVTGPAEWLDRARGLEAPEVFRLVAEEGQTFVSRGDRSGTHDLEMSIWLEAGVDPTGEPWYLETGQGMGETLLIADQREAVTLAEYGAFLASGSVLSLIDLEVDPGGLDNQYTAITVAGSSGSEAAMDLLDWLTSPAGSDAIVEANLELFGAVVYEPQVATG